MSKETGMGLDTTDFDKKFEKLMKVTMPRQIEKGLFDKVIPDEVLASIARNLFEQWRQENNIKRSFDLCNLYVLVLNYIKILMVNDDFIYGDCRKERSR